MLVTDLLPGRRSVLYVPAPAGSAAAAGAPMSEVTWDPAVLR